MFHLLLCVEDGVIMAPHRLIGLLKFVLTLGEIFLALNDHAYDLFVLFSQPVDLLLHIRKP